jgi:hypothetical protein
MLSYFFVISQALHWREASNNQIALKRLASLAGRGNKGL